jgi:hypothetical protein
MILRQRDALPRGAQDALEAAEVGRDLQVLPELLARSFQGNEHRVQGALQTLLTLRARRPAVVVARLTASLVLFRYPARRAR